MLQFTNLKQVITTFSDEKVCRDFLVQQRWNGSPVCPYCGSNKWYSIEDGKRFKCGNKECYKKYSVTVGTFMHDSNLPLSTWLQAMYLITSRKKGISSCQIAKDLGITKKSAWFILQRLRTSFVVNSPLLKDVVEVDEVYFGTGAKNLSNKRRKALRELQPEGVLRTPKTMVIGMIERGGNLKLEVAGADSQKHNIISTVFKNVDKSATLMTDGEGIYPSIGVHYTGHHFVSHNIKEYVRAGIIHTNTIEGVFGLFRRMVIGTYHKMSPKHLSRYCAEMEYRYNTRKMTEADRFELALQNIETPLSWKDLTKNNGLTAAPVIEPEVPKLKLKQRQQHEVLQILQGEVIARFPSILAAAEATGIIKTSISKVVRGVNLTAGGYQWKYS